ncbi:MAG: XisI protein [Oscillatoriaceae cyanobacterium Prado104]|jgi:hypothetical protein|nr:XisI protein [Oscillatoriaceae cyanobacterium Prado104]
MYVENELFFDPVRDRYRLIPVVWKGLERIYYTVIHFDIKDGKIWLQRNATDIDIGYCMVRSASTQTYCF